MMFTIFFLIYTRVLLVYFTANMEDLHAWNVSNAVIVVACSTSLQGFWKGIFNVLKLFPQRGPFLAPIYSFSA